MHCYTQNFYVSKVSKHIGKSFSLGVVLQTTNSGRIFWQYLHKEYSNLRDVMQKSDIWPKFLSVCFISSSWLDEVWLQILCNLPIAQPITSTLPTDLTIYGFWRWRYYSHQKSNKNEWLWPSLLVDQLTRYILCSLFVDKRPLFSRFSTKINFRQIWKA